VSFYRELKWFVFDIASVHSKGTYRGRVPEPLPLHSIGVRDTPPRVSSKGIGGCHTPTFWKKRLQVIDSKEREREKEGKEAARV
jgi:hypothetical protein